MQVRIVIACALPFELQVTYLDGLFSQRKRALAFLTNERFYFVVERHPRTFPRHRHQQRVPAVRAEGPCYRRAYIGREIVPLERRPNLRIAIPSDSAHTKQSKAERSDSPYRPVARQITRILCAAPLLLHA